MIVDAMTNPPMPEWNELSNEERVALGDAIDADGCCYYCCTTAHHAYSEKYAKC